MTATRAIARAHVDLVQRAGIPCADKFQNRAGRAVYHYPEWAAILLQISCLVLEQDTNLRDQPWLYRVVDMPPKNRHATLVFLLRRAKTDVELQQRLLGISAWADLEADQHAYEVQAYKLWGGLWADALRWSEGSLR